MFSIPRVGVGVFLFDLNNRFLLGIRKSSIGAGKVALPGGHLEFGESFEECAARELHEETGVAIPPREMQFLTALNCVFKEEKKHYVTVFMACKVDAAKTEVRLMEPMKCAGWDWATWTEIQSDYRQHMEAAQTGVKPNRILFEPFLKLIQDRPGFDPGNLI